MKKNFIIKLLVIIFVFFLVSFRIMANDPKDRPVTVSPGSDQEVSVIGQDCPTFSWSAVDSAASYRVAVFVTDDTKVTSYEEIAARTSALVSKDITGPALSWTLSSEESLKTGNMYAWYVQAVDAYGNAVSGWSKGKIFKVKQEAVWVGIEEKLGQKLKEQGVSDQTIKNVLADIDSEIKQVVVQTPGSNIPVNPGNIGRIQGLEDDDNTFYGLNAGASISDGFSNTFIGVAAGLSTNTGDANSFIGHNAGRSNIDGHDNIFIGDNAGYSNSTGAHNILIGNWAGYDNISGNLNVCIGDNAGTYTTGNSNTFIGNRAGKDNNIGYSNTALGDNAGVSNTIGDYNCFVGYYNGKSNTTGNQNTYLGSHTGYQNISGVGNVFLGFAAGFNEAGSNKLYIDNSGTSSPLIYGDFSTNIIKINGSLGVGISPSYPLHMSSGAYCSAGGIWTDASSRSLKENIRELSTVEALEALSQLNPVIYNYKLDKTDDHVGFIAEDVPGLVATADRKGMSPMDVTAVLTRVVQELRKENEEYRKLIADLQERMAKLEKK